MVGSRFLARSGLPWLTVDMEHTHTDINTAALMFGAIADAGCVPLARILDRPHDLIKSRPRLRGDGDRRPDGDGRRRGPSLIVAATQYPPRSGTAPSAAGSTP